MILYTQRNPFIIKHVPNNIFKIGTITTINNIKYVTLNNEVYFMRSFDAIVEQSRKPNETLINGIYTCFVWFLGNDTSKCRIEVLRTQNDEEYTELYVNGNRNYQNDISIVDTIATQNLSEFLNEA